MNTGECFNNLTVLDAGTSGFISNLRQFLWIKVQQFTSRGIQVLLQLLVCLLFLEVAAFNFSNFRFGSTDPCHVVCRKKTETENI